ncbi:MAG: sigma-54-dependent Fis family transcriptional regulator [Desulfovibrionaceae bacterium]|nr:sigma-54-dependent Fis family transcriptional regulator [Desulfovibrionaceae bacterium]
MTASPSASVAPSGSPVRERILLIDDERQALMSYETALWGVGFEDTVAVTDAREGLEIVAEGGVVAVLLDLIMPAMPGEQVLEHLSREHPDIPVLVITGVNDVETAVACMHRGAFDYILKPLDRDRLTASVARAVQMRRLRLQNDMLSRSLLDEELRNPGAFSRILTCTAKMRAIFRYCEAVAPGQEPVLITGETGTGKELFARALHDLSERSGEFVAVNAAGLDDQVFADTLFGHRKGAFTGAETARPGLIESAASGTLFLDEIGDLPEASQIKLLRVLQEREYMPLGADAPRPTDARIIAATHKDVRDLQAAGTFRRDLYYRLTTHHIRIPPLRDRADDIPLLLEHFLEQAAREFGKKRPAYPAELLTLLRTCHFTGNVRELRAMIYDALSRHSSRTLSMEVFKEHMRQSGELCEAEASGQGPGGQGGRDGEDDGAGLWASMPRLPTIRQATESLVNEALNRSDHNLRIAAAMLGISHQALSKRLRRSGS